MYGTKAIQVLTDSVTSGLVYVDTTPCMQEGKEYVILPGVYSVSNGKGSIVVMSLSSKSFTLNKGVLLARCTVLLSNIEPVTRTLNLDNNNLLTINSITMNNDTTSATIDPTQINVNNSLSEDVKDQLCRLLNEHRDCFAFSLEELGKTQCTEIRLELKDHVPVTYRPYRLSLSERNKVTR